MVMMRWGWQIEKMMKMNMIDEDDEHEEDDNEDMDDLHAECFKRTGTLSTLFTSSK